MQGIKGPTAPSSVSAAGRGSHQPPAPSHQLLAGDGGVPALLQGQEESESGAGRGGGARGLAGVPALLQGREESGSGAGRGGGPKSHQPPAVSLQPPGGAVVQRREKVEGRPVDRRDPKARAEYCSTKGKWDTTSGEGRGVILGGGGPPAALVVPHPASGLGCPAPRPTEGK